MMQPRGVRMAIFSKENLNDRTNLKKNVVNARPI